MDFISFFWGLYSFYTQMAFITEIIFFPLMVTEQESADLATLKDYTKMTDAQQAAIRNVALLDIGAWILYSTLIWACKGCMLFIYSRLSFGLWQEKLIKTAAVASVVTYIAVIITVTCHCLPYSKFWEKTNTPARMFGSLSIRLFVFGYLVVETNMGEEQIVRSISRTFMLSASRTSCKWSICTPTPFLFPLEKFTTYSHIYIIRTPI